MPEDLLQYIVQEEQAGFSEDVIRKALLTHGYTQQQVNAAFKQLQGVKNDTVHQYVQDYARQGKEAGDTFQQLRQQGYDAGEIRSSIKNVYGATTGKHHTIIFTVVALFVGAAGMYLLLGQFTDVVGVQQPTFSPSEKIALALEDAKAGKNGLASCNDQLEGEYLERCYAVIAAATEDSSICNTITNTEIHDSCWMSFIDTEFDTVCAEVHLPESQSTCSAIAALRV